MLTGRKLLLADDSPTVQKVLSLIFGDEGMEVSVVGSGAEVITALAQGAPDIVLADVLMPEPNGYQVCEHVKRAANLRHIPVLLLRGTFEPFDEAEARRVGADGVFMTKPFQSLRDLVSKVGNLLGGHADEKQADEPDAPAASAAAADIRPQASAARAGGNTTPAYPWERARAEDMATSAQSAPQAPTFNDFDVDDQTIQTTPAAAFGTPSAPRAAPYDMQEVEAENDMAHTRARNESFDMLDAEPQPVAPQAQPESMAEMSYTGLPAAQPAELATRAAYTAAADDALLDLGDTVAPIAGNEADEFVLDLDDESYAAPQPAASAPRVMYAEGLATSAAEAAVPLVSTEAPATDMRALAADAPAYAQPSQAAQSFPQGWPGADMDDTLTGPAPGETSAAPPVDNFEPHTPDMPDDAAPETAWQETAQHDVAAQEMSAPLATTDEVLPHDAPAAESAVGGEQGSGAMQLSPEMIDAIARRVVALMSDSVVREVAWEVVPDLAERLIRQHIEDERTKAQ